jgi:CubicO group peptidase (beta-lactamase class C family)
VPVDVASTRAACARQQRRVTQGIDDMPAYLARQVGDRSHREVIGPLLPGRGASGVVRHDGRPIATWGDPTVPEMLFSATKSIVALIAGVAYDRGWLEVDAPVDGTITWRHLLQQTSGWNGELWGKPAAADAQSAVSQAPPGSAWAYNDVRVNLLCLALTALFRTPLPAVLREALMEPLGASDTWSWHGYDTSHLDLGEQRVHVVSGGAHWGGGLWMSASDLALIGELCLRGGEWRGERLLSQEWLSECWRPCPVRPDYGYLWWLNTRRTVFPTAPASGRCARGNGGRHLLWIDPERDLVIVSHWGEDVERLLAEVSAAM